ncbi:site-specific integrase [Methylophaga pinxianii]|uniref:site-specific integrase n=1 Tax=Methylophaga pinxianii TaxID=2881052 RepID=UPI001CF40834|nr:site-specific integrase [Methylophaga pinxianii]MCB2427679.1 site-specific integrase [Methylophaga pinxianii]UPH46182.1 site-specific integrase [Methylophaga pinxianii]
MKATALIPSINELENGGVSINPSTPIWHSKFSDDQWIIKNSDEIGYQGPRASCIDWRRYMNRTEHHKQRYCYCLSEQMVLEIKIAAFIYAMYPNLLKGAKTSKTMIDGKTVSARVLELAKIGSHLMREESKNGFVINSFSDITFNCIKFHAASIGGRPSHLVRAMRLLTSEVIQRNLPKRLQLSASEIDSKSINWGEETEVKGIQTLSDPQFLFLLNYCKRAIAEFKIAIGFDIHDRTISDSARPTVIQKFSDIRVPLESYLWGTQELSKSKPRLYRKQYGYTPAEVRHLYKEAHKASMLTILLLTGMRLSEAQRVQNDSLRFIDGIKYLISKVVKKRHESSPLTDRWIATPIVEDAYDVLSYACNKTNNRYLFSSPTAVIRKGGQGYSVLDLTFNRWFQKIDQHKLFKDYTFSVHQCRETLAHQLAKHKVGLPFISKQLKHFHSRFNRMPNAITVGYGNYRKSMLLSIESRMASAREEVLNDMFGEDKSFAGGGGELHKNRIDAWFKGAGLFGEQRAKYIARLANSNISLMPTSIGICTHNFVNQEDGKIPPPCYGDFSCDPDCPNHVISEGCSMALKNRQLHAENKAKESKENEVIWLGLAEQLSKHVKKFEWTPKDG